MKKLIIAAVLVLSACETKADACKDLIKKVCKAKMIEDIPPDVVAQRGAQLLQNCTTYVWQLKEASGVSDDQCVADMSNALQSYSATPL